MPRIVVDLESKTLKRIKELLQSSTYRSVQEFIWVSVENQIHLEKSNDLSVPFPEPRFSEGTTQDVVVERSAPLLSRPSRELRLELVRVTPTDEPLWGMYYRYLPLKAAVRGIANLGGGSVEQLLPEIGHAALGLGETIREYERLRGIKRGYGNSQGLPGRRKDAPASVGRYLSMFVGRVVRRDGSRTGMMHALGFGFIDDEDKLALTREGLRFAELKNPTLDENLLDVPLGGTEREFILAHIKQKMRGEYDFMAEYYRTLQRGATSPRDIARHMHKYLRGSLSDQTPSNSVLETMTSGVQSRMIELGLVTFSRVGAGSRYGVTESGQGVFGG